MEPETLHLHRQHSRAAWNILGKKLPADEVVFFSQVVLVYIIIITCIVNLSCQTGDSNLWTCLMSSCLGYLLPNPKIDHRDKRQHESTVPNPSIQ